MAARWQRWLASLGLEVENILNVAGDSLYHLSRWYLARLLRLPTGSWICICFSRISCSITRLKVDVESLRHVAVHWENWVENIYIWNLQEFLNEQIDVDGVCLLNTLSWMDWRVCLMGGDIATFFAWLLLLNLRRIVARLLHLRILLILHFVINDILILQSFRHLSLVLPRYFLLLYLFESREQLV